MSRGDEGGHLSNLLRTLLGELRTGLVRELGGIGADLDRTGALISDATAGLSEAFLQLQRHGDAQSALLSTLLSAIEDNRNGPSSRGVEEIVAQASGALQLQATLLKEIGVNSSAGLQKAEAMGGQMSATLKLLDGINTLAKQTHVLSINATIEARRVGDAGRGFEVVAKEVRELAGYSKDLAERIADQIERTQEALRAVRAALANVSTTGARAAEAADGPAAAALSEMDRLHQRIVDGVGRLEGLSRDIAAAVSTAVRCMQFGDIVGQLVGNMRARIDRLVLGVGALEAISSGRDGPTEIAAALDAVRGIFSSQVHNPVSQGSMSSGDVEMF
jgi:methyl-accepting chemotaxis protein